MNNELYETLTLDRIRGFANKHKLRFNADELFTIHVWLNDLIEETAELEARFRSMWLEKLGGEGNARL